jgi:2-iminobutanoate/2-iminopropanoate deaminase
MTRSIPILVALLLSFAPPAISQGAQQGVLDPSLPFSEAVKVGDTLYLSGQLGAHPGTKELAPGGLLPQAVQAMENIKAVLGKHGYSLKEVVKCTVMLADIDEWSEFNDVYVSYFEPPYPARSAFAAADLALGARVEIECIAAHR